MKDCKTYDIYYDKEGDFLEITFGFPSESSYSEEIEEGVFISRDEVTGELISLGILSFKKRAQILNEILKRINIDLPLNISI